MKRKIRECIKMTIYFILLPIGIAGWLALFLAIVQWATIIYPGHGPKPTSLSIVEAAASTIIGVGSACFWVFGMKRVGQEQPIKTAVKPQPEPKRPSWVALTIVIFLVSRRLWTMRQ